MCVLIGIVAMVASVRISAGRWRSLAVAIYGGALVLLGGVAAGGSIAYGARRWLSLGAVVFQPSELAKLGLLLMLAVVLGSLPRHRHRLLMAVPIVAVPIALTLLEPDLSTAILLALVAGAMLLLARVRVRSLLVLVCRHRAAGPDRFVLDAPVPTGTAPRLPERRSGRSGCGLGSAAVAHRDRVGRSSGHRLRPASGPSRTVPAST